MSVSYDIVLTRPSASSVMAPAALANFDCDDPALVAGQFPQPAPEDYPFFPGPGRPHFPE